MSKYRFLIWPLLIIGLAWYVNGRDSSARSPPNVSTRAPEAVVAAEKSESPTASAPAKMLAVPAERVATAPVAAPRDSVSTPEATASVPAAPARVAELERRARSGDKAAIRDWVDALSECAAVLSFPAPQAEYLSHLQLMSGYDAAVAESWKQPLRAGCEAVFPDYSSERGAALAMQRLDQALQLWAASGDPLGQLIGLQRTLTLPMPAERWQQMQAAASAYLDPARPQTLVDVTDGYFQSFSRFPSTAAWRLAACDLGYDCAPGGAMNRYLCLQVGECFEGAYEAHLTRTLSPREWQAVQGQRRALLELLRAGDTRTPFDAPPPGGP